MHWPSLVPDSLCKIPIHIDVTAEGLTEDGGPIPAFTADLLCNYQDKVKTILQGDGKSVQLTGRAYFNGDIAPDLPVLSGGTVRIFGVNRRIYSSSKGRNPDGTVNYTELELI